MSNKAANIKKIVDIIESTGKNLVDLRPELEKEFPKKDIDFSFAGAAHFTVKTKEGSIIIVNKKYVDGADAIVGEIAIGYSE